jgi:hypothetical protein
LTPATASGISAELDLHRPTRSASAGFFNPGQCLCLLGQLLARFCSICHACTDIRPGVGVDRALRRSQRMRRGSAITVKDIVAEALPDPKSGAWY